MIFIIELLMHLICRPQLKIFNQILKKSKIESIMRFLFFVYYISFLCIPIHVSKYQITHYGLDGLIPRLGFFLAAH